MKALQVVIAILLAGVLGLQAYQLSRGKASPGGQDAAAIRKLALALQESSPRKALEEYERYARAAVLSDEEAANLYLAMGNLALERLSDHETALGYFLRVQTLYPKSEAAGKVGRKIVVCLENLGQSFEAQRKLAAETALTEADLPREKAEDVLAEVGGRPITRRMFEANVNQLPPDQRQKVLTHREARVQHLHGMVATELFSAMAARRGYDREPDFVSWLDNVRKTRLAKRIWDEEITQKVQVTDSDFYNFYQQHPERFRTPAQFKRVGLILTDGEAEARRARERIEAGEEFEAVAAEMNREEALRASKGLLSPFYEGQESFVFDRDLRLTHLLSDMATGELKGPVKVGDGSAVIRLIELEPSRQVPFDEARETRREDFETYLHFERKERLINELMKAEKVVVHENRL